MRQYADRLGFDRNFTIYDVDDRNKLVKDALAGAGMDDVKFTPERLATPSARPRTSSSRPRSTSKQATDFFTQTAGKVYPGYEKHSVRPTPSTSTTCSISPRWP